jgi:hypothetical protein
MSLGFIQPLTELSIWYLPGSKLRHEYKADNFITTCEPIV